MINNMRTSAGIYFTIPVYKVAATRQIEPKAMKNRFLVKRMQAVSNNTEETTFGLLIRFFFTKL